MSAADGIRKLGFRRWYERQLIESHAFLVTGFLSLILAFACIEEFGVRGSAGGIALMGLLIAGAAALCMAALGRYRALLERAEHLAEQSVCPGCGAYGLIRVLASRAASPARPARGRSGAPEFFSVECRRCSHQWGISTDDEK